MLKATFRFPVERTAVQCSALDLGVQALAVLPKNYITCMI